MTSTELLNYILDNQEDYETCIHAIQSELLRAKIQGLAESNRGYERIDKEYSPIRLTTPKEAIEGNICCTTNQRCGCSST